MKIVSLISSGRKKGNTERIVRRIEKDFFRAATENKIRIVTIT